MEPSKKEASWSCFISCRAAAACWRRRRQAAAAARKGPETAFAAPHEQVQPEGTTSASGLGASGQGTTAATRLLLHHGVASPRGARHAESLIPNPQNQRRTPLI